MALSLQLSLAGLKAENLETACTVTLEQKDGGFAITESHLELKARVPGVSSEVFLNAAQAAKAGCPVSRLFNTSITLNAQLEG
jgi:osmotically inducible protein OsmC